MTWYLIYYNEWLWEKFYLPLLNPQLQAFFPLLASYMIQPNRCGICMYMSDFTVCGVWFSSGLIMATVCPERYNQSTTVCEFLLQASSKGRLMGIEILEIDCFEREKRSLHFLESQKHWGTQKWCGNTNSRWVFPQRFWVLPNFPSIFQTQKTIFDHVFKKRKESWKYHA